MAGKNSPRDLGEELLEAVREIKAYKRGERTLRTRTVQTVSAPSPAEIRTRLKLSQQAFAVMLGVSVRTVQEWEQGRRSPRGPAKSLLRIADRHPEVFLEVD